MRSTKSLGQQLLPKGPYEVSHVRLSSPPGFLRPSRGRGAKAAGRAYERKAQKKLAAKYPVTYLESPWLTYRPGGETRLHYCQPDGFLIIPETREVKIVEIKLKHTIAAFHQLYEKYLPVTAALFGDSWTISMCEVVKWFDCAEAFPVEPKLRAGPHLAQPGEIAVWICPA